jgi:hypothetical protein
MIIKKIIIALSVLVFLLGGCKTPSEFFQGHFPNSLKHNRGAKASTSAEEKTIINFEENNTQKLADVPVHFIEDSSNVEIQDSLVLSQNEAENDGNIESTSETNKERTNNLDAQKSGQTEEKNSVEREKNVNTSHPETNDRTLNSLILIALILIPATIILTFVFMFSQADISGFLALFGIASMVVLILSIVGLIDTLVNRDLYIPLGIVFAGLMIPVALFVLIFVSAFLFSNG